MFGETGCIASTDSRLESVSHRDVDASAAGRDHRAKETSAYPFAIRSASQFRTSPSSCICSFEGES